MTPYEERAWSEIRLWADRPDTWFDKFAGGMDRALEGVLDIARKVPGVDWTIDELIAGIVRVTNEITQDTLSADRILRSYREDGLQVETLEDLHDLSLEVLDDTYDGLPSRYRRLALAEGAAAGYAGAAGILPDIFALTALTLRATGETALRYGFDISKPEERLYALQVLGMATRSVDAAKQVALAPSIHFARTLARNEAGRAVERAAVSRAIRNAARALGLRLTRAKMAQVAPVSGAVIASGFNAYYTSKVCDAAYYSYRERWLKRQHGVTPALTDGSSDDE